MMPEHVLSFVTDSEGSQVSVHLDEAGLTFLIRELKDLQRKLAAGECDHAHLLSEDWGGDSLSLSKLQDQKSEVNFVHHVKIYSWTQEWVRRHELK